MRTGRHLLPGLLVASLMLPGCVSTSTQPTHYFRLNPEAGTGMQGQSPSETAGPQPKLGLGPVHLAGYLDRPQLISRLGPYRLQLNDFDYWAGSLQDNILSGLVDAMQARLGGNQVIAFPWHSAVRPSYQLLLDISRFDAEAQEFVLQVRWGLLAERGDKLLALRSVTLREPMRGTQPEALVAAASRVVQRLAEQLVAVIGRYP